MRRAEGLARLGETFDVLVIGGGATGLGVAVDAAARGYRTALIEAEDFAKSTSSRSTKLVHGGVRYLAAGEVGLVREALHERSALTRNAGHVVHDLPLVVPAYRAWDVPYYAAGLKLYDLLAGRSTLPGSRMLSRRATLAALPLLAAQGLRGGVRYHDGQFDDARLAVVLARSAVDHGAVVVNYVRAQRLLYRGERVCGAVALDGESGEELSISARAVVNATGIFVDALRGSDQPSAARLVAHSRGTHIVVRGHVLGGGEALLIPKTDDGRVLFAIPWYGHTLIGTTDIPVSTAELDPQPSEAEIAYLLGHVNRYLTRPLVRADVSSAFAGLRPLVDRHAASTAALSREHYVEASGSGLITVTGGKWTTYRKMAQDVVDLACKAGGLAAQRCTTVSLPLHGALRAPASATIPAELKGYGTDAPELLALIAQEPSLGGRIHERLPYVRAQVVYAARCEMARTLDDVLARRTRALFLDAQAALEAAPAVAALLRLELGRSEAWERAQCSAFERIATQGFCAQRYSAR